MAFTGLLESFAVSFRSVFELLVYGGCSQFVGHLWQLFKNRCFKTKFFQMKIANFDHLSLKTSKSFDKN
jgi:hypothetical protein